MTILVIFISVIIWGLLFWLLWWALGALGIPEPFNKVAVVLLVIMSVVVILGLLTGASWVTFPIVTQLLHS